MQCFYSGSSSLLHQAEYHIEALQSAFVTALYKSKRAPGLAGFGVDPNYIQAVCCGGSNIDRSDPRLKLARGMHYCQHMEQLYHIYAAAILEADQPTLRLLSEFKVDVLSLMKAVHYNSRQRQHTNNRRPSCSSSDDASDSTTNNDDHSHDSPSRGTDGDPQNEALVALCLPDYNSIKQLVGAGIIGSRAALEGLADGGRFEEAADLVRSFGTAHLGLTAMDLLDLSTDAAMDGHPGAAWTIIEQAEDVLGLVLLAVEEDQLVSLTANPMVAFRLAWDSRKLSHAIAIYKDFFLRSRLTPQDKVALMQQAVASPNMVASLLLQEQDAGFCMLQHIVKEEVTAVANCLLRAAGSSSHHRDRNAASASVIRVASMLKTAVALEGSARMQELVAPVRIRRS